MAVGQALYDGKTRPVALVCMRGVESVDDSSGAASEALHQRLPPARSLGTHETHDDRFLGHATKLPLDISHGI